MKIGVILAACTLALRGASTLPAQQSGASCTADAYHALDFWIGHWDVRTARGGAAGTSDVEAVAGGCGVLERWTGTPGPAGRVYLGAGLHMFDPATGSWQQTWTDNRPAITLMRGAQTPAGFVYTWQIVDASGKPIPKRYTLSATDGVVHQVGERSDDGQKTWTVEFDYRYTKAPRG